MFKKFIIPLIVILFIICGYVYSQIVTTIPIFQQEQLEMFITHNRDVGDDLDSTIVVTKSVDSLQIKRTYGYFSGSVYFDSTGSATDTVLALDDSSYYIKLLYLPVINYGITIGKIPIGHWRYAEFYDSLNSKWIDSVMVFGEDGVFDNDTFQVRFPSLPHCSDIYFEPVTPWDSIFTTIDIHLDITY